MFSHSLLNFLYLDAFCAMGNFNQNLKQGQLGESLIAKWLQGRGHAVFPAYQIEHQTGKGPQLFTASGDLVLPDLLAFQSGRIQWVEAKHKTCFTWHRLTKRWVTGIDLRHYQEYRRVASRTSLPVWLMFWHPNAQPDRRDVEYNCPQSCPVGLFGNDLSILTSCENHRSDKWGRSGMVYWAHKNLRLIASVNEVMA